jgi:hypothetical protein
MSLSQKRGRSQVSVLKRACVAFLLGACLAPLGLAAADGPKEGFAPDPPAKASTKHWVFDVTVRRGRLFLTKARSISYAKPVETARVHGRFAVEFSVGNELLDRIRFDVPMMGLGPNEKSKRHPFPRPGLDDVTTQVQVKIADNARTVSVRLVDRATGSLERYQWPPEPDGRLIPWTTPVFHGEDAWPPPLKDGGSEGGARDAGPREGGSPR